MLRSMYSGISGMKNFQTKLDVIGNNIANVNTFGFKKGRVTFQDMMNQEIAGATAPGQGRGGVNPKQVGLGSTLAAIDTIHTQGSMQTTARSLDLALSGDGFFLVGSISDLTKVGVDRPGVIGNNFINGPINNAVSLNYTRAGNFYLDENGYLANSNGMFLIGRAGEKKVPTSDDIATANTALLAADTFGDEIKSFFNISKNYYEATESALLSRQNYDAAIAASKEDDPQTDPEVIMAKTAFTNSLIELEKVKKVFDGDPNTGGFAYFNTKLGKLDGSTDPSFNKAIKTFNEESGDLSTKNISDEVITSSPTISDYSQPDTSNNIENLKKVLANAQDALMYIEKVQSTHHNFIKAAEMLKEPNWTDSLSESAGLIQLPKTAKSFSIGSDGTVTFVDQRGDLRIAGKIMVAKFENSSGLQKVGDNLFRESTNSGTLDKDGNGLQLNELFSAGEDGAATISTGTLEMSNVDLSEEFTEMITAQRGFQANTRIITTSDEILQELVNLKR